MNRNPVDLSDDEIDRIVTALREHRALWLQAEAKGAKRLPKITSLDDISLDDLGL